ncbi:hypothetical protein TREMEDRAFT_26399 [Tremella mesenterica DSM 1558]|uniref:uncharacterized protein n=1 Tax=Tremella mesenterica (strain ATCC 24925 / CBS 8224 / DSM 1558 / NBRC 9311 / NRRL Y-6157 / RJB 2259-6 / UBC 559-6) TaxID=578456 RepID=UPI0003F4A629|nr:uncharacterized protein TREMEDRAFT_26399 [Tremella mesenterica DSM 1558]EIW73261.1 hypothetical protein TREMEDRAFT_26399 [Tremella mesenterica DSM 1558]
MLIGKLADVQLAFYQSYHSNKINQLIHFIFIPQILWSGLIILSHVPWPGTIPKVWFDGAAFQPSLALALIAAFQTYYIVLDPLAGTAYLPVAILFYLSATWLKVVAPAWLPFSSHAHPTAAPFGWTVFVVAWIAQFIGHGVFEHRAPALTDNLVQALVTAPFFVHMEFLFYVFNYRPEVQKRVKDAAGVRIREMNRVAKNKVK